MSQVFAFVALAQLVSVNIQPEVSEEATEAALSSCSLVLSDLGEAQCALPGQAGSPYEVSVRAVENAQGLQVSIELERDEETGRQIRVLSFSDRSAEQERWQAVGLVIAALVSAEVKRDQAPPPQAAPIAPPPEPQRMPITTGTSVLLEVGVTIRQEASFDLLTGGSSLRATVDWGTPLGLTFAFGGLAGTSPVQQIGFRPSLGVHLPIVDRELGLAVRGEVAAMVTRWSAEDAFTSDERWHTRIGVSLGPTVFVPFSSQIGLFGGFVGTALFPPVRVSVEGEDVGRAPVFGGEGSFGLWARFGH